MTSTHHWGWKLISLISALALATMGMVPVAMADPADAATTGTDETTAPDAASDDVVETAVDDHIITQGMNFTVSAAEGNWDENATLETDGYEWDAEENILYLSDVTISIEDPADLIEMNQFVQTTGEVPTILCAIALPADAAIQATGGLVSISVDVDNAGSAVAAIVAEGDFGFTDGEGALLVQCYTDGSSTPVGLYVMSGNVVASDNTATSIIAGTDQAASRGIYGVFAPLSKLIIGGDAIFNVSAFDYGDGEVQEWIAGAYVDSLQVAGLYAEYGGDYANPGTKVSLDAEGNALDGAHGLIMTGTDPDDITLDIFGAAHVEFMGTDDAVMSTNWNEDLQVSTYNYLFGDEGNPFFGHATNDLDGDGPDKIIYLGNRSAENPDGQLSYNWVCLEPVSLTNIFVAPATATVAPGGSASFGIYADAAYPESFPENADITYFADSTWEVVGNQSTATTMNGSTLNVAVDETATQLQVIPSPGEYFNYDFPTTPWNPSFAEVTVSQQGGTTPGGTTSGGTTGDNGGSGGNATTNPTQPGSGTLSQTGDMLPGTIIALMVVVALSAGVALVAGVAMRARKNGSSGR